MLARCPNRRSPETADHAENCVTKVKPTATIRVATVGCPRAARQSLGLQVIHKNFLTASSAVSQRLEVFA